MIRITRVHVYYGNKSHYYLTIFTLYIGTYMHCVKKAVSRKGYNNIFLIKNHRIHIIDSPPRHVPLFTYSSPWPRVYYERLVKAKTFKIQFVAAYVCRSCVLLGCQDPNANEFGLGAFFPLFYFYFLPDDLFIAHVHAQKHMFII